jgi:hypothetical protein
LQKTKVSLPKGVSIEKKSNILRSIGYKDEKTEENNLMALKHYLQLHKPTQKT